jgi:hypothetical protein
MAPMTVIYILSALLFLAVAFVLTVRWWTTRKPTPVVVNEKWTRMLKNGPFNEMYVHDLGHEETENSRGHGRLIRSSSKAQNTRDAHEYVKEPWDINDYFLVNVKNVTSDIATFMSVQKKDNATGKIVARWDKLFVGYETQYTGLDPDQSLYIEGYAQMQNACFGGKAGVRANYTLTFQDIFGTDPTPRHNVIEMDTAYCWKHNCHYIYFRTGVQPGAPGTRQTCR